MSEVPVNTVLSFPDGSDIKNLPGGRSQDGGGIGRVITFSSTNSLKEQQNGEQSLQNNF